MGCYLQGNLCEGVYTYMHEGIDACVKVLLPLRVLPCHLHVKSSRCVNCLHEGRVVAICMSEIHAVAWCCCVMLHLNYACYHLHDCKPYCYVLLKSRCLGDPLREGMSVICVKVCCMLLESCYPGDHCLVQQEQRKSHYPKRGPVTGEGNPRLLVDLCMLPDPDHQIWI